MIERQEIDGRPATVQYLSAELEPVLNKDDAELVRVVFDDGESCWLIPPKE